MRVPIALVLAATASAAQASAPGTYAAVDRASAAACRTAAGLRNATISAPTRFSDRFLIDARVVTGSWPQRHMKGTGATMLCLYNRRTRRAEVQELAAAIPPAAPPVRAINIRDAWWQVAAIDGIRPIGAQPLTLMLKSDGKVEGSSGCNSYGTTHRLTGTALSIATPIEATERGCAPAIMAQEERYRNLLGRAAQATRAADGALVITTADGRTLRYVSAPKG